MALRISLQNTGDTDQLITLFDSGGLDSSVFIPASNVSGGTQQNLTYNPPSPNPSQNLILSGQFYYLASFDTSDLTLGGTITINYIDNGVSTSTSYNIPVGITLPQLNANITTALRVNRPNASFNFILTDVSGTQYLQPSVNDDIADPNSFYYQSVDLTNYGTYLSSNWANQMATSSANSANIVLDTFPNTSFSTSGFHTIQCTGLTSPSSLYQFTMFDSYYYDTFAISKLVDIEVQLTQTLAQNFSLQSSPSAPLTILGNTTAVQTFTAYLANAPTGTNNFSLNLAGGVASYNGQVKIRIKPNASSSWTATQFLNLSPSNINSYLSTNPLVYGLGSVTGVGLYEILNSVTGNSYKVTSLYIWSPNPRQLTQPITYGKVNANGNLQQTNLNVVIDPYAQNQVVYRTNDMDDFKIDNNSFIRFTLKAKSFVSIRFEFLKNSFDEIKLVQIGLGELLGMEEEVKEDIDKSLIDDFDTFYSQQ